MSKSAKKKKSTQSVAEARSERRGAVRAKGKGGAGAQRKTASKKKKGAAHDAAYPPAFVKFMMSSWQERTIEVEPLAHAPRYAARRARLASLFPGETLIIPTGHELFRNGDANYRFRPDSSFYYLTGNQEPDGVLLIAPRGKSTLFVEPNPGRKSPTFFMDRHKGELWVGPRLGVAESKARFGVEQCLPLDRLPKVLARMTKERKYRVMRGVDSTVDRALPARKKQDHALRVALSEMRLIKDEHELDALRRAGDSTRRAFEDIVRVLPRATNERDVEGAFYARARKEGNDVGYNIIAAAGAHACVLHWNANDGVLDKRDLLLVDAGVEGPELYTADVTRALPMSGKFSPTQREVYDLVRAAQVAAIEAVKPGAEFLAPHRAAMRVLAEGLVAMGIIRAPIDEAMDPKRQIYRRYTLHGTSHMLGLDVHDCDAARPERYRKGQLAQGMVLTIEPGLYFQPDDLTVPERYRGIGVRIEDDVVVTATGARLLTDVPRDADEIEAWMASIWVEQKRGNAPRKGGNLAA